MFILDTDHITILESRKGIEFKNLLRRIAMHDRSDLHVSIVSFHEQVTGWSRDSRPYSMLLAGNSSPHDRSFSPAPIGMLNRLGLCYQNLSEDTHVIRSWI